MSEHHVSTGTVVCSGGLEMKVTYKDRKMKTRVVDVREHIEKPEVFENCEVLQVFIEPIYGGIFGDI